MITFGSELLLKMCAVPDPEGTDEEIVRQALKAFRRLTLGFRYGGLCYEYKLSKAALEAFERTVDLQPSLFDATEVI